MMLGSVSIAYQHIFLYSSESPQRDLSNDTNMPGIKNDFKISLHPCALDESSLSIGRAKEKECLHSMCVYCIYKYVLALAIADGFYL